MKTIVVGAGGGGIASAFLAAARGEEVELLEAHSLIGGCASWFGRGPFHFDAGATTVSGLLGHEPLGKLFALIGAKPTLVRADPGIVIHLSNGRTVSYYSDFERWMGELEREFPHLDHRPFWQKVSQINARAWNLLEKLGSFPDLDFSDYFELLKTPEFYVLSPYLLSSTDFVLRHYHLEDATYRELIDGLLLISTQGVSANIPFLVGAMGLGYPAQTWAMPSGMKSLMDFFEMQMKAKGIRLQKRKRVSSLSELQADRIILNLTSRDADKIMGKETTPPQKFSWGAFTLYFGCQTNLEGLYHQVHLGHPLVENYFLSLSVPGSDSAPEGWRSVTISTHVELGDEERMERAAVIMRDVEKRFGIREVKHFMTGTPKTFERFTSRAAGGVGGHPFYFGQSPFSISGHMTELNNVYRVGDTTFPGQGLVGVVAGAQGLDHLLRKASSR